MPPLSKNTALDATPSGSTLPKAPLSQSTTPPTPSESTPFFSLLVPVYNTESYIARCLESCIAQSFKDIEILVIDDCGQDNAIEIAKSYALKDPRIQILHNPQNLGLFHTRGVGIKQARGKYILHVDSDDFIAPETCQRLHERITQDYASSGVYSDICCFGMHYYPATIKRAKPLQLTRTLYNEAILRAIYIAPARPPWHIWGKVFLRTTCLEVEDFISTHLSELSPIVMGEDVLRLLIATRFSHKLIALEDCLYYYCDSTSSICRQSDPATIAKRKNDLHYLITTLASLKTKPLITPTTLRAITRAQNILHATIILESRHATRAFAYPIACFKSLTLHQKWQTYVRIALYFISFGRLKL